jgi:alpha-ketoglutarate-dependent taurine dioxygenase
MQQEERVMLTTYNDMHVDALLERVSLDNASVYRSQMPDLGTHWLSWLRSARRHDLIESSDGDFSYVHDEGKSQDYSANERYFAAHTDGLYYRSPPQFGLLYCLRPGAAQAPTFFIDTARAIKTLSHNAPVALAVLRRLDQVYIGREDREYRRPFIEINPLTGEETMNITLGRGYARPSQTLQGMDEAPHQQETVDALQELFAHLREATVLTHEWTAGDLLAWDNYRFIHGRGDARGAIGRLLVRAWFSPTSDSLKTAR